uniref:Gag protein n=1 Tax=Knipowitschia caucasica TaxID=637954 RepID=A0AAV2K732_KNICA
MEELDPSRPFCVTSEPNRKPKDLVINLLQTFAAKLIPGTWNQFDKATAPTLEQAARDLATDAMTNTLEATQSHTLWTPLARDTSRPQSQASPSRETDSAHAEPHTVGLNAPTSTQDTDQPSTEVRHLAAQVSILTNSPKEDYFYRPPTNGGPEPARTKPEGNVLRSTEDLPQIRLESPHVQENHDRGTSWANTGPNRPTRSDINGRYPNWTRSNYDHYDCPPSQRYSNRPEPPDRGPDPPDYHGYRQLAYCQEAPRDPLSHNRQDSYSDRSQCPRYPDFPDVRPVPPTSRQDCQDYRRRDPYSPTPACHRERQMHGPIQGRDYPGPTNRDFDRIARHINRFEPQPGNPADPQSYLRDIDFYSKHSRPATRRNYDNLCQALLDEYSDFGTSGTLTAALTVRQARNEPSDAYYHRLRQAYFGNQNYQNMEEDKHFKALFIQNLHPSLSLLLGVTACPVTQNMRQLRTLVARAQSIHTMRSHNKPPEAPSVYSVGKHSKLKSAPAHQLRKTARKANQGQLPQANTT